MSRPGNYENLKSLADTIVWASQSSGLVNYAEAHISGGAETTVDTNLAWQAAIGFASDITSGITFNAGETGAITAYAVPGVGQITVTANNTLSDGDIVTITGSTNYNGIYTVTNTSGTDFEITHADNGDDAAGNFNNGSNFVLTVAGV